MSQVKATAKSLRTSMRKMNLVAALVRGRSVGDALVILEHTPKRAATMLAEVIKSAAANAENNHKLSKDNLYIESLVVNTAGVVRRYRIGSRGHIDHNDHHRCHVSVVLAEVAKPQAKTSTSKSDKKSVGVK